MKLIKHLANRIWHLCAKFSKKVACPPGSTILTIIGMIIFIIIGIIILGFFMRIISGFELGLDIDNREILIQGILISSAAVIGITGVFLASIWSPVGGKPTKTAMLRSRLSWLSLIAGLSSISFAVVWCFDSRDNWIFVNITSFCLQLVTFILSVPSHLTIDD